MAAVGFDLWQHSKRIPLNLMYLTFQSGKWGQWGCLKLIEFHSISFSGNMG